MDPKLEISLLYDFYGGLIPVSQQSVIELYVNDDLSLSEVADILGISRQGVRDSLNRGAAKLRSFEQRLGLLRAYRERSSAVAEIRGAVGQILARTDDHEIAAQCESILRCTDRINEREEPHGV